MNTVTGCLLSLSLLLAGCAPAKSLHYSRNTRYTDQDLTPYSLVILPLAPVRVDSGIAALPGDWPRMFKKTKGPDRVGQQLNLDFCRSSKKFIEGPRVWCDEGPVSGDRIDTTIVVDWVLRSSLRDRTGRAISDSVLSFPYVRRAYFNKSGDVPDFALQVFDVQVTRSGKGSCGDCIRIELAYMIWDYRSGKPVVSGKESWRNQIDYFRGLRTITDPLTVKMILGSPFEGPKARRFDYWFMEIW